MVTFTHAIFTLVSIVMPSKFWMIKDSSPYTTAQKCATQCLMNEFCAGFQFDMQVPTCSLVVHQVAPGSALYSVSVPLVFKRADLEDGSLFVYELAKRHRILDYARQPCLNIGMELLPMPTILRDVVTVRISQWACIWTDLQRQDDGTYSDVKGERRLTEAELIVPWRRGDPTGGDEKCVMMCGRSGTYELVDYPCVASAVFGILCAKKV